MDAKTAQIMQKAMNLVPTKPVPPVVDLLRSIVDRVKVLGDGWVRGSRYTTTQAHLNGVLSMLDAEIAQNAITTKINNNNAAQKQLDADKAALNKNVQDATGGKSLGALA